MKYIVAVSGGVDSVVLLDMLAKAGESELVVAHFDHGIRPDSAADARFVEGLAKSYGLPCEIKREELGDKASEELARTRRYEFLRQVTTKHQARIVTAHHADDAIETIAINLTRGTGWRGLAALGAADVERPLLDMSKQQIYDYALNNRLEWVEDSTNSQDTYLRNRLRRQIATNLSIQDRSKLLDLFKRQRHLRGLIEADLDNYTSPTAEYERHLLIQVESQLGQEILGSVVQASSGFRPTRPQLDRALLAVKTARAHEQHQISRGWELYFTKRTFIVRRR